MVDYSGGFNKLLLKKNGNLSVNHGMLLSMLRSHGRC